MIFVDASALVAIATNEPEAGRLVDILEVGEPCFTSPLAVFEAVLAVTRKLEIEPGYAMEKIQELLDQIGIEVEPLEQRHASAAKDAHVRFGKGRGHPAQLNLGDCFSYAATKLAGASILFVGNDFSQTDLPDANAPGP